MNLAIMLIIDLSILPVWHHAPTTGATGLPIDAGRWLIPVSLCGFLLWLIGFGLAVLCYWWQIGALNAFCLVLLKSALVMIPPLPC
ncbi:hypothetical protein ACVXG7_02995 [Enterobacter hormaechei]